MKKVFRFHRVVANIAFGFLGVVGISIGVLLFCLVFSSTMTIDGAEVNSEFLNWYIKICEGFCFFALFGGGGIASIVYLIIRLKSGLTINYDKKEIKIFHFFEKYKIEHYGRWGHTYPIYRYRVNKTIAFSDIVKIERINFNGIYCDLNIITNSYNQIVPFTLMYLQNDCKKTLIMDKLIPELEKIVPVVQLYN